MTVHEEDEDEASYTKERERSELFEKALLRLNLQDMILIVPLKGSGISGAAKKMLHAPSLKMMVIKEVPIYMRNQQGKKIGFEQRRVEKYSEKWKKFSF